MKELLKQFQDLSEKIRDTMKLLKISDTRANVLVLSEQMNDPNFWKHPEEAKNISAEFEAMRDEVGKWDGLLTDVQEGIDLLLAAQESGENEIVSDMEKKYAELFERFSQSEFSVLLSGDYADRNALVAVHAGAGGVDAQDWADMVFRMLLRFSEKKGWKVHVLDRAAGQEAGLKRAVFEVVGRYAYGYLQSESGVHRLVRISPFDAEAMRHTSFCLVEVLPDFPNVDGVVVRDEDIRIDVFRSGGHGGQGVNTTDSAVRIVHIPTGITVTCQNERSQQQNRATAMRYLKAKLYHLELQKQKEEKQKIRGEFTSAEWGSQIRSYVLHPYKLVKDHRTKYEETDPEAVLNGQLQGFIEAYLRYRKS